MAKRTRRTPTPPALAQWLVARRLSARRDEVLDDLAVSFRQDLDTLGRRRAAMRYWWEALNIGLLGIGETAQRPSTTVSPMLYTHYLRIAIRKAARQKGYSFINLFGLAVGIACFAVIMLYVQDELSYDRFHKDADRIYRVVRDQVDPEVAHAVVPPALMVALPEAIPEVATAVRIYRWDGALGYEDAVSNEIGLLADSSFFEVFSFPFVRGSAPSALRLPTAIVITERLAARYFGEADPLGKTLTLNLGGKKDYQVSGVIEDVPLQSHFGFDYVIPFHGQPWASRVNERWANGDASAHTYIKLGPDAVPGDVAAKIQRLVDANNAANTDAYALQPLAGMDGIHLSSHRSPELQPNSDKRYIMVLLLIALFVILIAAINYVNLATARSALRAKEIGVRKVVGAPRAGLVRQFLAESLLTATLAGLWAIVLAEAALPFFNTIVQKQLSLFTPVSRPIWWFSAAVVLAIGLLAGLYPALYLSSFKPVSVLRRRLAFVRKGLGLRQGLVVFQFGLAALLIVGLVVVQNQLRYIQNAKLGFDKDQVIVIENVDPYLNQDIGSGFRHALAEIPGVRNAGAGGRMGTYSSSFRERMRKPGSDDELFFRLMEVDYNFLDVMGIELIEGRNYSPAFPADSLWYERIILNETAVKRLGLQEPVVGQQIIIGSNDVACTVIGVVKDFHFSSFRQSIDSFGFIWWARANRISVKLAGGDVQGTLARIEDVWKQHAPGAPFEYYFLDDAIDQQYRSERNFRSIFSTMAGLSLVIACLGLFGLAAFTAELRTREIGIRKVMGASVTNIVALLSRDFVKLVVAANVVAWPVAYLAMNAWLDNFAYRISVGLWTFALAGAAAVLIAALTVSYQALKAATANPVDSLRHE